MVLTICLTPTWAPTLLPTRTGQGSILQASTTPIMMQDTVQKDIMDNISQGNLHPRLQRELWGHPKEAVLRETHLTWCIMDTVGPLIKNHH